MLTRQKVYTGYLLILSILIFDVFQLTPLDLPVKYLTLILSTFGHAVFLIKPNYFPKELKKWYWLFIGMMLISIITTNIYYQQSFISGFVANFSFYNIGIVFLFYFIFQKSGINFERFLTPILKLGWIILAVYLIMAITGFQFTNVSDLTEAVVDVGIKKMNKDLINFIAIIWFVKFLFSSKYKHLFFALLFFSVNHWGEVQRFILLVSFAVMGIGILINKNFNSSVKFLIPTFLIITFGGFFFLNTDAGKSALNRFDEAFKIFSSGPEQISDSSTAVRLLEIDFAMERFEEHPFLGNGNFRSSLSEKVIGDRHFYISDIGLFGVLYVFGILGIVVFLYQWIWTLKNIKIKHPLLQPYSLSFKLVFLFLLTFSLLTAKSILSPSLFLFYIVLYFCLDGFKRIVDDES